MDEQENPPPDSPEAQAIDRFFAAAEDGDEDGAAEALRGAGSLSGFALTFLAELLDPAVGPGKLPWRLRLVKVTKGRPRKTQVKSLGEPPSPFLREISGGSAKKAAKSLGARKKLSGSELKLLAELLDRNAPLHKGYSFRLRFVANKTGRPINKLEKRVNDFYWRRILLAASAKKQKSLKGKVQEVIKILEARKKDFLAAGKKPKALPSHSTVRNIMERLGFLPPGKKK
ncbi:MAG: hypothetical protein E7813_20435 [Bradyrhizobium sp.]|uniref:hypothetical protein n=1 Tax=Bradyrhizobium sp. TaxID=376 RepID=UPI001216AA91|nr:hypothetical protein [Bradyrhizobium sp.]THD62541.1 MAG: hypothetical protein E7813_20435 [Bradyrhizobium sp.]